MTDIAAEADQSGGLFHTLRIQHDDLQRRVDVNGKEIGRLQAEVVKNKGKWYHNFSVLLGPLALVVSLLTYGTDQFNVVRDHNIQDRSRLSSLIKQLPTDEAQDNGVAGSLTSLDADSALALMDRLGAEASTASEKIQVADALVRTYDLANGKRLAIAADQQATTIHEKAAAEEIIGNIYFQTGDAVSGRALYQRIGNLFQTPQKVADSPLLRSSQRANVELVWASNEVSLANNCPGAIEHLQNAKRLLNLLPQDRVTIQMRSLNDETKVVNSSCPNAVGLPGH